MPNKQKDRQRGKYLSIAIQTLLGFFDVLVSLFLALLLTFVYFYTNTSEVTDKKFEMNETSVIYDSSGNHVLYKIFSEENRKVIPHEEIPDTMRWATIAAEDDNFYNHFGIDIKSTLRAARANFQAEEIEQGA